MVDRSQDQREDTVADIPVEFELVCRVCVIWSSRSTAERLVYDRWYGSRPIGGGPIGWRLIDLDTVDKYSYDENDFVRQVQTAGSEVQQDFQASKPDVLEELSADLHRHFKRYEPDFDAIATAFTARTDMALPYMVGRVYYTEPKWHNVGYVYAKAHGRGYEVRGTSDKAMRSDAHYHSLRAVERQETGREQYPGRGDVEEISFCYFPDALPEKLSTAKMWELLGQIREVNKGYIPQPVDQECHTP